MTPQQIDAMKLALEALEEAWIFAMSKFQPTEKAIDLYDEARAAINEALKEHAMQEVQRLGQEIEQCQCPECQIKPHASDCAVHSEPAYPKGECDCGEQPEQEPVIGKWSLREVYFDEDGEPISHRSPPQRTEQEHFGFAGVKMWVGGKQVVKLLTQTEFHYATQPWLDMLMIAEKCLVELREKNA